MSTTVIDKKTGKRRRVDPKKSRTAKAAARKRVGRPMKAATKAKIAKARTKAATTGRTKAGRRVVKAPTKSTSTIKKVSLAPRVAKPATPKKKANPAGNPATLITLRKPKARRKAAGTKAFSGNGRVWRRATAKKRTVAKKATVFRGRKTSSRKKK